MRAGAFLERLSSWGAAAQASVPGAYAWGVTVAPAAWARGSSSFARVASVVALAALFAGVFGERRWGWPGRLVALWGFVLGCAVAWSATPQALAPLRVDLPRGIAGMIGWALFALASAAPALQAAREAGRVELDEELRPREVLARGDGLYVAAGVTLACALQLLGWHVATPERAILVRFTALAAGLAVIGAATDLALARHLPRAPRSRTRRLRQAMTAFVVLALLGLTGLVFVVRG
jgi:hypothetical protein